EVVERQERRGGGEGSQELLGPGAIAGGGPRELEPGDASVDRLAHLASDHPQPDHSHVHTSSPRALRRSARIIARGRDTMPPRRPNDVPRRIATAARAA